MTKKDKKEVKYDYLSKLDAYKIPNMLKSGIKAYINENNLEISSDKDLDKIINEFKNSDAGV